MADDSYVDLFGDFRSDDEASPPAVASPPKRAADTAASSSSQAPAPKRQRRKLRSDIADFYELEAEEGAASGDEEEDDLDGFLDLETAEPGQKGLDQIRRSQEQKRRELEEVRRSIAAREKQKDVGARRVFGGAFLDKLEERYREMEEDGVSLPDDEFDTFSIPDRKLDEEREEEARRALTVPTEKDPKLWYTSVRAPEKEIVIKLLHKAASLKEQGEEPPVYSVFAAPNTRGYIYIEAHKESDVRTFCQGIYGIMTYSIKIVPMAQMPLVYTSATATAAKQHYVKVGDWVRLKRGRYQGDLAEVMGIDEEEYFLRMKPRIDIAGTMKGEGKGKRKYRTRPAQRWFNRTDVERHLVVGTSRYITALGPMTFFTVDDEKYRDGYCWQSLRPSYFDYGPDKVRPSEHEVQDWRLAPPIDENTRPEFELEQEEMPPPPVPSVPPLRSILQASLRLKEHDIVIVTEGEMKNLRGRVTQAVTGEPSIRVELQLGAETQTLSFQENMLNKWFEAGDRVQILDGEHEGDIGNVVRVNLQADDPKWGRKATAVVVNEALTEELTMPLSILRRTDQLVRDNEQVGEFSCGQMVRIDDEDVAIITKIEVDSRAVILNSIGQRKSASFAQLRPMPRPDRDTFAIDRKGRKFNANATVKAPRSNQRTAPILATVIYIHGVQVFLKAQEYLVGDKAFLVCRAKTCEMYWLRNEMKEDQVQKRLASQEGGGDSNAGKLSYGIKMASELDWLPDWYRNQQGQASKNSWRNTGIGVEIRGGQYKGLRGEVRKDLGEKVRISLLAQNKLVEVWKNYLLLDSEKPPQPKEEVKEIPASPFIGDADVAGVKEDSSALAADDDADDPDAWIP